MRRTVAQVMEVAGFGSLTAGVYLVLGLGAALIAGGVVLAAGALALERGA